MLIVLSGSDQLLAQWLLKASSVGGLRPREWNQELVSRALGGANDSHASETTRWLEYNWYADRGQVREAGEIIEWWLKQRTSPVEQALWWYEAAWFEAFSKGDVAGARERLRVADDFGVEKEVECSAWKARAAIAAREGRFTDASYAANRAQLALRDEVEDKGITKGVIADLHELLERAGQS